MPHCCLLGERSVVKLLLSHVQLLVVLQERKTDCVGGIGKGSFSEEGEREENSIQ